MENKIRALRREQGITQEDFARAIGVTRQTIISIENGKYDASLKLAHKISVYFGKSIEEVFVFDEKEG